MYDMDTRDRIRDKQDRILELAARLHLDDSLQLSDGFPGSPRIYQLHGNIFPEWEAAIDAALRSLEARTQPDEAPDPHDHATRDAAQRADEAELAGMHFHCRNCGNKHARVQHDSEHRAYILCPRCQFADHTPPTPTLAQRIALALDGRLPVIAGGSEDLDTHAVRELDLYAENTSELYPQFQAIIANLQRKIARDTYDAARAPKLWRYWYDAAAKRYQTDVCPMRFTPAVRQAAAEQRALDEYTKITAGEYDPAPERILAP